MWSIWLVFCDCGFHSYDLWWIRIRGLWKFTDGRLTVGESGSCSEGLGYAQCSSVAQSCPTLCDPMDCSTTGFSVYHQLPSLLRLMSIESMMPFNHLILCRPLLFLSSIFPSIRVFSSESVLHIRWPKYWSFSFSISPSNEYSGLISFRMDWLDLLAFQGTLKNLSNTRVQKHQFFGTQVSL